MSIHTGELAGPARAIVEEQRRERRSLACSVDVDGDDLGPAGTPARIAFEEAEMGLCIQGVQFALSGLTIIQEESYGQLPFFHEQK